jgi:uncharacterized membrane protein YccF (DUF307 family)
LTSGTLTGRCNLLKLLLGHKQKLLLGHVTVLACFALVRRSLVWGQVPGTLRRVGVYRNGTGRCHLCIPIIHSIGAYNKPAAKVYAICGQASVVLSARRTNVLFVLAVRSTPHVGHLRYAFMLPLSLVTLFPCLVDAMPMSAIALRCLGYPHEYVRPGRPPHMGCVGGMHSAACIGWQLCAWWVTAMHLFSRMVVMLCVVNIHMRIAWTYLHAVGLKAAGCRCACVRRLQTHRGCFSVTVSPRC